jgi:DNA-directed RNA polymerase subunit RPC12/RpoP
MVTVGKRNGRKLSEDRMSETIEFFELESFASALKSIKGFSREIREIDEEAKRKSFTLSFPGELEVFEYPEKIICSCGTQFAIPDRSDLIICPVCGNKISVNVKTTFHREKYSAPEDTLIFSNVEVSATRTTIVVGDVKGKENVLVISNRAKRFKELREQREKLQNELWELEEKLKSNVEYKILAKKLYNFFYKNSSLVVKFDREKFVAKVTFENEKVQVDVSEISENFDKYGIQQDIVSSLITIRNYFEGVG